MDNSQKTACGQAHFVIFSEYAHDSIDVLIYQSYNAHIVIVCGVGIMRIKTSKYDVFSKVFTQLSGESQDRVVKIAHNLLRTHQFAQRGTARRIEIQRKAKTV
ncbi:MAG: hypothetical protein LBB89_00765 [Treponema sp.]|nr:hypothetical protein [Treponema sp.]